MSEPLSEERLTEIRQRVEKTTPGPWESETAAYAPLDSVHIAIRTRDKLPEHPWSPRFIAWMTGAITPMIGHTKPRMQHCPTCDRTFFQSREVSIDMRADDDIQADAEFIAHAPTDVRDLLAEIDRFSAELQDYRAELENLIAAADATRVESYPYAGPGHTKVVGPFPAALAHARRVLDAQPAESEADHHE